MLNFSKIKIFFIVFICCFAVVFATPSFIPQNINSPFLQKLSTILPNQKVNLGLDLRGGSQLMLEVGFQSYYEEQLKSLNEEIKNSFHEEFVKVVPIISSDKIIFSLIDEEQRTLAKKLVKKISKKVEIDESDSQVAVYFSNNEKDEMKRNLIKQSIEIVRRRIDENGTKEPVIQAQGENRILLQVPGVQNSSELKNLLGKTAKMTFHFVSEQTFSDQDTGFFSYDLERVYDSQGRAYLIKKEVVLSGDLLIDASATYHEGQPAVLFKFNAVGAKKFAKITEENIGRFFAIVLDGKVVTAPRINSVINQGSGVISGSFTTAEANQVALLLRAGALPAPLKIIEERTVGPSLGFDSVRSGTLAALVGFVFIAVFMILYYGMFGIFADIALVVNIAIILAILSFLGATVTLPGIAGIVLTMGMSVDANVLIFERIKEEIREKKSNLAAIEQGFHQAFRTIIDSNITTLIVAFFLFMFGNGPVKGFAVTLSIGIVSSMFSATILTRMMISQWLKFGRKKNRIQKLSLI